MGIIKSANPMSQASTVTVPVANISEIIKAIEQRLHEHNEWLVGVQMENSTNLTLEFDSDPAKTKASKSIENAEEYAESLSSQTGHSVVFIKPHAVHNRNKSRGCPIVDLLKAIEENNLELRAAKVMHYTEEMVLQHYKGIPEKFQLINAEHFLKHEPHHLIIFLVASKVAGKYPSEFPEKDHAETSATQAQLMNITGMSFDPKQNDPHQLRAKYGDDATDNGFHRTAKLSEQENEYHTWWPEFVTNLK